MNFNPATSLLQRIPLRESKPVTIVCAALFVVLSIVLACVPSQDKAERNLEKRRAEGRPIAVESYIPIWLLKGLKVNVALAGLALVLSPWLGRRRAFQEEEPKCSPWTRGRSAACLLLVGVAAWHNYPRLFHSMWGDEEFNASRFILSSVVRDEDGAVGIKDRPWAITLWSVRKPTNHLAYSFFARLSHELFFDPGAGPQDPWFSEALLRLPIYIAGLLLIPAFIWSLRVWGLSPWWGLLLMMMHPWFTRFGVDGRGYGFLILGGVVGLGVVGRALQTGYWRWWVALALVTFGLLWSNFQGIYLVAALNFTLLTGLLTQLRPWADKRWLGGRWIMANGLALMLVVGYLAPCWPMLQEFMDKGEIKGGMDARFIQNGLSSWLFGHPWAGWSSLDDRYCSSILASIDRMGGWVVMGVVAFIALVLGGLSWLLADRRRWPLIVFSIGAPGLMMLHMYVEENKPYDWYLSPFVPGLLLVFAAGTVMLPRKWGTHATLTAVAALYLLVTWQPRYMLRNHPIEQSRESVQLYRDVTNPRHEDFEKEVIGAGFIMFTEGYDPAFRRFENAEELRALMAEADQTKRQLAVNVGSLAYVRTANPTTKEICAVLEESGRFEHRASLPGLQSAARREVFLYPAKSQ